MAKGKAARGVLGNDPFLRGAAVRAAPPEPEPAGVAKKPAAPSLPKKGAATRGKASMAATREKTQTAAKSASKAKKPAAVKTADSASARGSTRAAATQAPIPDPTPLRVEVTTTIASTFAADAPPKVRAEERLPARGPEAERFETEEPRYAGSASHGAPSLSHRAAGALGLAREILIQALRSEKVEDIRRGAQGLTEALFTAIGTSGSTTLDAFGRDASLVEKLRPLTEFLYERYWRVHVEGAVHVPAGPVILVANHSGAVPYDGPVLAAALQRERPDLEQPRWLVEDQIFYAPFFGTLLNRLGAVRANPDNAVRLLADQRPVLVFPEGFQALSKPYSERYQLKRFGRGGFVKIALRQRCSIVPVAVIGSEETTPLLAKLPGRVLGLPYIPLTPLGPLPLPARWNIRFGEPIDLEGLGAEAADDLVAVQRLTERTRESIQEMLRNLLRERQG